LIHPCAVPLVSSPLRRPVVSEVSNEDDPFKNLPERKATITAALSSDQTIRFPERQQHVEWTTVSHNTHDADHSAISIEETLQKTTATIQQLSESHLSLMERNVAIRINTEEPDLLSDSDSSMPSIVDEDPDEDNFES
jgi:hypothetical protein